VNNNVQAALEAITQETGVRVELDDLVLSVEGQPIPLPIGNERKTKRPIFELTGEKAELFGIKGLLPTVPRGDDRDKLLWNVLAVAGPDVGVRLHDSNLAAGLQAELKLGPEASRATATALTERFFNSKQVRALLPVHASLPLNYDHTRVSQSSGKVQPTGYRMFNGGILPFLLWDSASQSIDIAPLDTMIGLVSDDSQLTSLDKLFLKIALDGAPHPASVPNAATAAAKFEKDIAADFDFSGGGFCPASLAQFRRDIRTVLDTQLPRPERVQWLTLLISLHLSVRMYRIAVIKGGELDLAVAAAGDIDPPASARACICANDDPGQLQSCTLAGLLKFRTGSGHYRPVTARDGCRSSYLEVDRRRLLDMPATLVTRTLAGRAWEALGGGSSAKRLDLVALTTALKQDAELRRGHGAACAAIAVVHRDVWRQGQATLEELRRAGKTGLMRPGLHALRDEVRRSRSKDLRHQSTDVVNQLMQAANVAGPGSLLARNGRNFDFYEVDEQLLLLLVRLVCRDEQLPFASFLDGLLGYGLAPQDRREQDALADTLERLGLLARYSDAGEASFVHYA
jgi:hypothetical protein